MSDQKRYYLIRVLDKDDQVLAKRCEKAFGPKMACKIAFGVIYDHDYDKCHYMDLGTRKPSNFAKAEKAGVWVKLGAKDFIDQDIDTQKQKATQEITTMLVKNAVDCTFYVALGKAAAKDIADKYGLTLDQAAALMSTAAVTLVDKIRALNS